MKVLFATSDLPWQAATGASLRDTATYTTLRDSTDLTLLCFPYWNLPKPDTPTHGALVYPAPWPTTRSARIALRLRATAHGRMVFQEHLVRAGAIERLVATVKEVRPDVLVLGHPLYDGFLPAVRPFVDRLVVDYWELRVGGARRRMTTGVDLSRRARAALDLVVLRSMERDVARYADEVWFVEPNDARTYAAATGVRTRVIPNTIDVARYARYHSIAPSPATFGFVGILYYDPNVTAVARLTRRILPLVRTRRPDARLVVIGRRPLPTVRSMVEAAPGATLRPDVDDATEEIAAAGILVAPLESGTGTRLKLLEAAASRVPIITTPTGLDGLTFVPGTDVLVAEDDQGFADAILRVWDEPGLRERLVDAAERRVRRDFDTESIHARIARSVRGEPEPAD